MKLTVSTGKW